MWYNQTEDDVRARLHVSTDGLTHEEAAERLIKNGKNQLQLKKPPTILAVFLRQFTSPFVLILLAAGVVSYILHDALDAVFIGFIVGFNAVIGTVQEYSAEKSAAALQQLVTTHALVLRDNKWEEVPAEDLVPGDTVRIESGSRVPADLRLIEVHNLLVDESIITGESVPQHKTINVLPAETVASEQRNMAFAGASVSTGRATGIVVATGQGTQIGQIARTVTSAEQVDPPLIIRMRRFSKQVAISVLVAAVLIGYVQYTQGVALEEVFFVIVALAVSAIPEGLPIALTVALSVASRRMSKRNVVVRKLASVESLGSCTLIASDKTGTLTVNQQTVKQVWLPSGEMCMVEGSGYNDQGQIVDAAGNPVQYGEQRVLDRLLRAALLANEAVLERGEKNAKDTAWVQRGDAMDIALLSLGLKYNLTREQVVEKCDDLFIVPYESVNQHSGAYCINDDAVLVTMKGATEVLLKQCTTQMNTAGTLETLTPAAMKAIEAQANTFAAQGFRVLAIAEGAASAIPTGDQATVQETNLTFLGLIAFIDPLRPEVPYAIEQARVAGVDVVMITGDHPETAKSIALELGLTKPEERVVLGSEIELLDVKNTKAIDILTASTHVFARVTPIQKLRIVESLRRQGHFVAVTGDGVNDAPALKTANIGVAMGSGTDVAKDTSAMIVVDDNFVSIVAGIEEGRFAYDNVRKVIYLLVSTGVAELALFIFATVLQTPIPLLAIQLLWLNVVTNGIQDIGLAFEKGEDGVMKRAPRKPTEGIFNRLMIEQTLLSGIFMSITAFSVWYGALALGWSEFEARNITLLLMVLLQNVHVLNCRSERKSAFTIRLRNNPILIIGVFVAQGVHILASYIPFTQELLSIQPVTFTQWGVALGISLMLLVIMEIYKLMKR